MSGGHTQLLIVKGVGAYERLGTTLDDALGEAFDKAAKLLGLGYPGGPEVEREAAKGRATIALPRPMLGRPEPHFSLAGLKTALRHEAQARAPLSRQDIADLCASFQEAVADIVSDRTARALDLYRERLGNGAQRVLVVAGGVAANQRLKAALETVAGAHGFRLVVPPPELCSDNAAMIAWAGAMRLSHGLDRRSFGARPRPMAARPRGASGASAPESRLRGTADFAAFTQNLAYEGSEVSAMALQSVGIVGAGAWGTALAITSRRAGRDVLIWAYEPETLADITRNHRNEAYLPGVSLDPAIAATARLERSRRLRLPAAGDARPACARDRRRACAPSEERASRS